MLGAGHRQLRLIQQSDLHEQGRLVPIDMLKAILPSLKPTTTTWGRTTFRPVGGTPGSRAGISQSWVKLTIISSTTRVSSTVRERRVIDTSFGQWPMNQVS